jgi:ABC-type polysaccharide/polyol phosphate transport system ATPase subunit
VQPPAASAPAVRVDGVSKVFKLPHEQVNTLKERALHPLRRRTIERLEALRSVTFDVRPGEFFGIVGRNGSGKSTLLKCLAGIYRIDTGEIWVRGRLAPFIELGVGFNPELTARDNVLINALMLGLTPAQARARYDEIIAYAELEDFVDLKLKNYSSGMQVRLAFAVMVQVDADVLLIDEVLAVGDAAFQQKCHDTLEQMRGAGKTILLVTHSMEEVVRFCDRAMLLHRGRLQTVDTPEAVARRYNEINFELAGTGIGAGPESGRSGDGAVEIVAAWFEDAAGRRAESLEQGAPCALRARVAVRRAVEDPRFDVHFLDEQRRRVMIVSSILQGERTGSFAPGELIELAVRFDNLLAPGRWYASPVVLHRGPGGRVMDGRDELASVVVTGTVVTGGIVDLPHELSIERVGASAPSLAAEAP